MQEKDDCLEWLMIELYTSSGGVMEGVIYFRRKQSMLVWVMSCHVRMSWYISSVTPPVQRTDVTDNDASARHHIDLENQVMYLKRWLPLFVTLIFAGPVCY